MKLLPLLACACSMLMAADLNKNFTLISHSDHAEVVSEKYGYRFDAPWHWYVSATNPAPFTFSYSPREIRSRQIDVPAGGAEISIASDDLSHQVGSIDQWVEVDKKIDGYSSIKELGAGVNPLFPRAVEVISYHDDGDARRETVTHQTAVYFEFNGHIFAAYLRFNANDRRSREFERDLYNLLSSFQKLPAAGVNGSK